MGEAPERTIIGRTLLPAALWRISRWLMRASCWLQVGAVGPVGPSQIEPEEWGALCQIMESREAFAGVLVFFVPGDRSSEARDDMGLMYSVSHCLPLCGSRGPTPPHKIPDLLFLAGTIAKERLAQDGGPKDERAKEDATIQ